MLACSLLTHTSTDWKKDKAKEEQHEWLTQHIGLPIRAAERLLGAVVGTGDISAPVTMAPEVATELIAILSGIKSADDQRRLWLRAAGMYRGGSFVLAKEYFSGNQEFSPEQARKWKSHCEAHATASAAADGKAADGKQKANGQKHDLPNGGGRAGKKAKKGG